MSASNPPQDFTKTKGYAYVDLASKIISSLALVALGIAGWMLQSQAEKTRATTQQYELQERKYLPMLRSLSMLELELERVAALSAGRPKEPAKKSIAAELEWDKQDSQQAHDASIEMRFLSASLFLPNGEQEIWITSWRDLRIDSSAGDEDIVKVKLPLRAAAFMYADWLNIRSVVMERQSLRYQSLCLYKDGRFLIDGDDGGSWDLSPEAVPAWKVWLSDCHLVYSDFRDRSIMIKLATTLRYAVGEAIQKVLSEHPDVGDRYVQIRDEIEKRSPLSLDGATKGSR